MAKLKKFCCEEPEDYRSCFQEFGEEISLEGIKYLLPQYGPGIRRFLWLLINILVSTLLLYHVSILVRGYLDKPISVNIGNELRPRALFPAVMLCNTMPYKLSHVNPRGEMHNALSAIFARPLPDQEKVEEFKELLESVKDRLQYTQSATFSLEDLVVHCVYKNRECNMTTDFETVAVEGRTCYLFNSGGNQRDGDRDHPFVYGSNFQKDGLQLTLNAMTYEAMNGPYTTQGVEVSFSKPDARSYIQQAAATVLIGQTNNIRISETEGQTCDELDLEFFDVYTSGNCYVEQQLKRVRKNCGCLSLEDNKAEAQEQSVRKCSLYDYLNCEINYYGNVLPEDIELCTKQCTETTYRSTISQARTAWARKIGEFNRDVFESNLARDLEKVSEIAVRYLPMRNKTMREVFGAALERLNATDVTMSRVTYESASFAEHVGDIPPLNFTESVAAFRDQVADWVNETRVGLQQLNDSVTNFTLALNDTDAFAELTNTTETEEMDPLSLGGGLPQSSFKNWLRYLIELFWPSYDELRAGVHIIRDSTPWLKFFPENHTEFLQYEFNETVINYFQLLTRTDGLAMAGLTSTMPGFNNQTAHLSLIDAQTCSFYVLDPYLTEDDREALAGKANGGLPSVHDDISRAQQEAYCRLMVCALMNDSNNCTVGGEASYDIAMHIADSVQGLIEQIVERVNFHNVTIEEYIDSISRNTTNTAKTLYDHVVSLKDHMEAIDKVFPNGTGDESLWPSKRNQWIYDLQSDIDNYTYFDGNFKNLSRDIVDRYDALFQTHTQQEAVAADQLEKNVNLEVAPLLDSLRYFQDLEAASENITGEYGPYAYAAKKYLWGINDTGLYIDEIKERTLELQTLMNTILAEIQTNSVALQNAMRKLRTTAEEFQKEVHIEEHFYENNFIMVNIAYQSLELNIIEQLPAYNFWSFLSDFGGTTGLYNGFCFVTIFQVIDTIIRRCFIYKMPCCAQCGKRREEPQANGIGMHGPILDNKEGSVITLPSY